MLLQYFKDYCVDRTDTKIVVIWKQEGNYKKVIDTVKDCKKGAYKNTR